MKLLKSLSLGLVAAAAITGSASAAVPGVTTVHVVGSTAFRTPDTAAIIDYLSTHEAPGSTHVFAGFSGSSLIGAGSAVIANGTIGTTANNGSNGAATIVFETFWTGSLAGVVDLVAGNNTGSYIDPANMDSTALAAVNNTANVATSGTTFGGGISISASDFTTTTSAPDIAFSDSFQGTISKELGTGASFASGTTKIGSFTTMKALATACGGSTITDAGTSGNAADAGTVGIVPFEWCVGNVTAGTTSYTNIGQNTAKELITSGFIPESFITGTAAGNPAAVNFFYLVGRNEDSGTRIGAFSEPQFGVTALPQQFQVGNSGINGGGSTAYELFPITPLNTEPGIVWNTQGHSGYATGGNVASALNVSEASSTITFADGSNAGSNTGASYFIGYAGITDAATLSGHAKALTYNGVAFSTAAVQQGEYTFWCYEHCYRLNTTSTVSGIADSIADLVFNNDADVNTIGQHQTTLGGVSAGILFNSMNCSRSLNEGGSVLNF